MTPEPSLENALLEQANETLAEAIEVVFAMKMAHTTGEPVWRWGKGDAFDTLEAARAYRTFMPPDLAM